jgi:hypothetical protein
MGGSSVRNMRTKGKVTLARTNSRTRRILTRFRDRFAVEFIQVVDGMSDMISTHLGFDPELAWQMLGEQIDLHEWGYDRIAYVMTRDLLRFADEVAEPSRDHVIGQVENLAVGDFGREIWRA